MCVNEKIISLTLLLSTFCIIGAQASQPEIDEQRYIHVIGVLKDLEILDGNFEIGSQYRVYIDMYGKIAYAEHLSGGTGRLTGLFIKIEKKTVQEKRLL